MSQSQQFPSSLPAGYDGSSNYHAYTPTTPSGASSSHLMSPIDPARYNAPGSQRTISNTPLGLADIRPRADSSMSDGHGASMGYDANSAQPGTSNYLAPWAIYAFDWCKWPAQGNGAGKLAVGSYLEDGHNFIQILDSHITPTPQDVYTPGSSKFSLEFTKAAEATHSYPVTRLLWEPPSSQKQSTDLLATSGDHLRLWSLPNENPATPSSTIGRRDNPTTKLTPLALLSNSKTPDHTAPLTSLDWNTVSPSLIITSSIDTTCTIWDIPSLTAKTQLIAHDKEVYDVRFCAKSVDVFVSCGQDGSVRMFDLRSLEHSTIIYEPTGKEERDPNGGRVSPTLAQQTMANPPPLLRLATSPHDTHLLATFAQDSNAIRILDVRQPGQALLELRGHGGNVNCIEWSPHRRGMLASGGDDCQVLLWDLYNSNQPMNGTPQQENPRSPVASWQCDYEIGNLGWVPHLPNSEYGEWLGVGAGRGIWGTRVA
ncbi:an11 protein [Fusarium fujikuroi]|nr:an11 protein [Fusarium fujikuroi]